MSQTRDQQRFTISEVAADWHERPCSDFMDMLRRLISCRIIINDAAAHYVAIHCPR